MVRDVRAAVSGLVLGALLLGLSLHGGSLVQVPRWLLAHSSRAAPLLSLTQYVNPFIGTIRDGNVFPGADAPFGMVQWSPDTSAGGLTHPGGYNYGDLIVRGFSLTHLSGAGCVAFGNILFVPTTKAVTVPPQPNESPYSARFVHAQEKASPGYYGVRLSTGIGVQLAVTQRSGLGKFVYPAGSSGTMLIDVGNGAQGTSTVDGVTDAAVHISGRNEVTGWATSGHFCGLPNRYTVYFAAVFDRPFTGGGTWNGAGIKSGGRSSSGPRCGAYLRFNTARQRTVDVRVGLSYVSERNALTNLQREEPTWDFATIRQRGDHAWNGLLNRVQVTGGSPSQRVMFYTALYHALLYPSVFDDVNGQYRGFDGRVHVARNRTQYANFSGWDIYRSEMQLLAWLVPREASDMVQSLVVDAEQGSRLPKWPVANDYTGEMDGDSADPIIAEAYAFGADSFDLHSAYRYMLEGAQQPGSGREGYVERPDLADYLRRGYVVPQTGGWGAAAESLEYGIDDFAIAQIARALGDRARSSGYLRRAQAWQHLFNPRTHFLEPRTAGGTFPRAFNPASMDGFVEGNSWQYTWLVPHNLAGLFRAMGGNRAAIRRLDRFFTQLNAGPTAPYYWGGNETDLEAPWEYDFAGAPWRTQATVRRIVTSLYTPAADGLPGNDDLGTLSAWYVWAAIGLFPEIPGLGGFVVGSPLFPHVTVHWGADQRLDIAAPHAPSSGPYVQALSLNGHPYGRTWLSLSQIMSGATLSFKLARRPNRAWGSAGADAPPSFGGP